MIGIYEIINLLDGKATAYVGSSNNILKRWRQHRYTLSKNTHRNQHLQRAWSKYGAEAFTFSLIEELDNENGLLIREQYWLDRYLETPNSCYNIARNASAPMLGQSFSDEHKRKIGEGNKGKKRTAELRQRQSKARKGKRLPVLGRPGVGNNRRGHKTSPLAKLRIGNANARSYPAFIHRETGDIIPSGTNLTRLCRERGLHQGRMAQVKNGKAQHHKGWKLAEPLEQGSCAQLKLWDLHNDHLSPTKEDARYIGD